MLGIIGVILFSLKAVLAKIIYTHDIDTISVLLMRMVFSFPFYIAVLVFEKRKKAIEIPKDRKTILQLILFSLLGYYLASLFDFLGLQYIKAGLERIILFSYPTIIILISWLWLKKKPSSYQILAIFITYIGIYICFHEEMNLNISSNEDLIKGVVFIFLCAICYAAYLVGSEFLIPKYGTKIFTSYVMVFACAAIIIHFAITNSNNLFQYDFEVYALCFLLAIFCTVIPSYLVSESIREIGANNFGIIASIGPIATIVFGFILIGEKMTWIQLFGASIVIGGILIITRANRNKKLVT